MYNLFQMSMIEKIITKKDQIDNNKNVIKFYVYNINMECKIEMIGVNLIYAHKLTKRHLS